MTSAAECAAGRREAYVDTRHLLDAILKLDDPEVDELLAQGGATRRALRDELFRKGLYREALALLLILHGRGDCNARSPRCEACPLVSLCPSAALFMKAKRPRKKPRT